MNCTPEQIREIGALPGGHAVIKAVNNSKPVRVQIIPSFKEFSQLKSDENITDEEIEKHMASVYKANPHFEQGLNAPSDTHPRSLLIGVNCNLNLHVIHHIYKISQNRVWKGLQRFMVREANKGDPIIGALCVIKLTEQLVGEKDDLSTHCDLFVWFMLQGNPEERPALEKIRIELVRQLGTECTITQFERTSLDWFYERISVEAGKQSEEIDVPISLLKRAAARADEEHERYLRTMEEAGIDFRQIKSISPELELKLQQFVSRKRFATNFNGALQKAREGNFKPLAKMLNTIVGILTPDQIDRCEVVECLVDYGIEKYGASTDGGLREGILSEVRAEMSA
jgi:hypothetical protein